MKGQNIIVFGAGSGCGQAIAVMLAKAGANPILVGRREAALAETARMIAAAGASSVSLAADVTDEGAVASVVGYVHENCKRIDAIINCAGINVQRRTLRTQTVEDFRAIIETNLIGAEITTRAVLTPMLAQGGGTIVNLGSIGGADIYLVAGPAYIVSKHALRALTRYTNAQYRHRGIRACHLIFGETETPLRHASRKKAEATTPLLQVGDVAAAVQYMLSASTSTIVEELYLSPAVLAPHLVHGAVPWGTSEED